MVNDFTVAFFLCYWYRSFYVNIGLDEASCSDRRSHLADHRPGAMSPHLTHILRSL